MSTKLTFRRLSSGPDASLSPWPWNPGDVVEAEGMKPLGRKDFEASGIVAGKWTCNAGKVKINGHAANETCFVLSGTVTITDGEGVSDTFGAGEAFLLPRGFRGLWANSDRFAKLFMAVAGDGPS